MRNPVPLRHLFEDRYLIEAISPSTSDNMHQTFIEVQGIIGVHFLNHLHLDLPVLRVDIQLTVTAVDEELTVVGPYPLRR